MSDLHEQVNEKTVALSIRSVKLTGRLLAQAMRAFLKQSKNPKSKHGEQSLRSLNRSGASLSNIEITGDNIGDFRRIARKYNVDYTLKRDITVSPPNWTVFFKAADSKALDTAFAEYSKVQLKYQTRKPSLLAKIKKYREKSKTTAAPVKNRAKGGHEH